MKRRPTPHLKRKRRAPHPSYRWEDSEDFDHNLIEVKLFKERPFSERFREHKRRRILRTERGRQRAARREASIMATLEAMTELARGLPSRKPEYVLYTNYETYLHLKK